MFEIFKKSSLKQQFKLLVFPVMVLTAVLSLFISYSEYKTSQRLESLEKDIKVIEDLRKLITLISKEREISLKFIKSDDRVSRGVKRGLIR